MAISSARYLQDFAVHHSAHRAGAESGSQAFEEPSLAINTNDVFCCKDINESVIDHHLAKRHLAIRSAGDS